jgi:uroporphyrinogen-III decarboxylase
MDLRLEKADLLHALAVPPAEADRFHFDRLPDVTRLEADASFPAPNQAHFDAIRYVARNTDLLPIGMAIGPFSLMTKLIVDPITPLTLAGAGVTAVDDESVRLAEACLRLAEWAVHRSLAAQVAAGARAILICEPAANIVYISPRQLDAGSTVFEQFVIQPGLRLKQRLDAASVDLIFHNCGELTDFMVRQFAERLRPVILSFGSSRCLWEDAALVPKDIVLYGNLPTRSFYSDAAMPIDRVRELASELVTRMRAALHPHILGSECDVLHVPAAAATIRRKVDAMLAK